MRKFITFLILLHTSFGILIAQEYYTISGYISDQQTGEVLINANVYDQDSKIGTITNSFGFYSIRFPAGSEIDLTISYIGYSSVIEYIQLNRDQTIDIALVPQLEIEEVTITAETQVQREEMTAMGILDIPMQQVKALPAIGGEKDILKVLQLMPGIAFGDEAKSGIYVRGGSPDQNLILLDDVPLYYVNHLGGFVSVFNPDAINSMHMIKGGFPADYGGRLSSVLDIRMKDGNMKEMKGDISLGLLTMKASIEGPIKKDTSSFLISVRRFMYDLLQKPLMKIMTDVSIGYTFYDINAKFNSKVSPKDRIYFSFYTGDDKLTSKIKAVDENDFTMTNKNAWGNLVAAFRWNHIYSNKLFGNLTYSYSKYRYLIAYNQQQYLDSLDKKENSFFSGVNDQILKYDWEYFPSSRIKIKTGIGSTYHQFTPGISRLIQYQNNLISYDTTFNDRKYHSLESHAYILAEGNITTNLAVNLGVRFTNYAVDTVSYYSAEPRFLLSYQFGKRNSIKYSISYMQQYIHLLSSSGIGMPSDLWVLSTAQVPPQKALHTSLGYTRQLNNNRFELSTEIYYKRLSNLIDYQEGASLLAGSQDWQDKIETDGEGESYGVEFLLQKKEGRTQGWTGISLSHTTRQFSNINFGNPYPYTYDRLIDIGIAVIHEISKNIKVSATWVFNTGNAFTLPIGYHAAINDIDPGFTDQLGMDYETTVEIYEGKNTFRAKPYHRLDLGIEFTKQKRNGIRTLQFSIYNAYNHLNPFYYYSKTLYDSNDEPYKKVIKQVSYFPIIPSVSYSFSF
ncbi:MAG: TonB-dependent receptor [Bacteroidales bacterium]|nr:TonB-dependent receptor [Bacteroidales bacterium]